MRILTKLVTLMFVMTCAVNSSGQQKRMPQQQKLTPAQEKEQEEKQRAQQQAQQAEQQHRIDILMEQNRASLSSAKMEISRVRTYSSAGKYLVLSDIYNLIDTISNLGETALYSQTLNLELSDLIKQLNVIQTNRLLTEGEVEWLQNFYKKLDAILSDVRLQLNQIEWQKLQEEQQRKQQEWQQKGGKSNDYYNHYR